MRTGETRVRRIGLMTTFQRLPASEAKKVTVWQWIFTVSLPAFRIT